MEFINSEFCSSFEKKYIYETPIRKFFLLQEDLEKECDIDSLLRWKDVCEKVLKHYPYSLKHIDKKILTYEMCFKAVKLCYRTFENVPEEFKTKDIYMIAFASEPYFIKEFPEEFVTYDLWLEAVKKSGYLIKDIPHKYITEEICLEAVKNKGHVIKHIPEKFLTEEIRLEAIKCDNGFSYAILKNIPMHLRTYDVCLEAVIQSSESFEYVPKEHVTYELCSAAAEKDSLIAKKIPQEYFTEELCVKLLKTSDVAFKYIPPQYLNEKICLLAISHGKSFSGTVLNMIPQEIMTQKMCEKAVEISPWSLEAVPDKYVTENMLYIVAQKAPARLLDNFPERFCNTEFCDKLINNYPEAARYVLECLSKKK